MFNILFITIGLVVAFIAMHFGFYLISQGWKEYKFTENKDQLVEVAIGVCLQILGMALTCILGYFCGQL